MPHIVLPPVHMHKARMSIPRTSSHERALPNGNAVVGSDDDLEDAAARHKSKKRRRRGQRERTWSNWLAKRACQWWLFALVLLLMLLWISEVSHLSQDHGNHSSLPRRLKDVEHSLQHTTTETEDDVQQDARQRESNLNKLDMPTRNVGGVREACLKLLSWDAIASLEFPPPSSSPVNVIQYKKLDPQMQDLVQSQSTQQRSGRNILFTGNQTMAERDQSYNVSKAMEVQCGFCSESGVFDIMSGDKAYMDECKAVVTTCNFGGGDAIYQPINMTQASLSKVCYVAFWDEVTLKAQAAEGIQPDSSGKIGHWRIVVIQNLPFADQRLNGKIPKMLNHRLFPKARYSIWVDSKSQFRRDPMGVLEALLWRTNSVFAISEHGGRDCVYKEGEAIVKKHKASPEEVAIQLDQYRSEGFPEKARFDGHKALAEASVIVREHTPLTNLFMCLWFNEVTRFTARDQLSFPYVLMRLGVLHINMFPVCTRKALVNSLGHVRKARPLGPPLLSI